MKPKYFGDSYDIVKKSLLQWLAAFGPWAAHPMFTDQMNDEEAEAFSRFIGVPLVSKDVLSTECDRAQYFASCRQCHSLFLDPDTGVRLQTTKSRRAVQFVFAEELIELAQARPNALTLTFDQSLARGREPDQIRAKLTHFSAHGVQGFAYVSHAAFLVLGRSAALVQQAHEQILKSSLLPRNRIITKDTV